jgi:hypothetical protein
MQRFSNDCQERYGVKKSPHVHKEQGPPKAHHHIATQSTNGVDLYQWVYSEERHNDPALKVHQL